MASGVQLRVRFNRLLTRLGFPSDWFLIPLAATVGVLAGLVAVAFEWMVESSAELFFSRIGEEWLHGGKWLDLAVLVFLPALGGLAVGCIQHFISRQPTGHGIPEVIEALSRRHGIMPGRSGVFKAITASLTIGSGGSAGVEGPIVQIGSVVASKFGQLIRLSHEHMNTLVGCGAAAGMASIFNAPIAGVIFVMEVILRDFSLKTLMPIVIASVFGTAIMQAVYGQNQALFSIPVIMQEHQYHIGEIGLYGLLGICCGITGFAFTRSIYASEALWQKTKLHPALRPAAGGALLGVMGVVFVLIVGRYVAQTPVAGYEPPAFFANGYPVIEALFNPDSYNRAAELKPGLARATLLFLALALVFKVIGTSVTLGSGGSGGIFAPSLFTGAALGGLFGLTVDQFVQMPQFTPATYALAGMAGVLAGTVHCPLTAFLLVFEITRDYKVILPVMLVAISATIVAQILLRDSVYTLALRERGVRFGSLSDLTLLRRIEVRKVPLVPAVLVRPMDPAQRLLDLAAQYDVSDYVVCDEDNCYTGLVVGNDVRTTLLEREAVPLMVVGELMRGDLPTVEREDTLDVVLDKFSRHDVSSLAVVDEDQHIVGMITRSGLIRHYQKLLEE